MLISLTFYSSYFSEKKNHIFYWIDYLMKSYVYNYMIKNISVDMKRSKPSEVTE